MNKLFSNKKLLVIGIACGTAIVLALTLLKMASGLNKHDENPVGKSKSYSLPDTLMVGILNSPSTYYNYRGSEMGFDYDMINTFSKDKKIPVSLKIAYNFGDLMDMLEKKEIDLIASPVPVIAEYQDVSLNCGPKLRTTQMLVQPRGDKLAKDVTDLIGRHITVEKDSKYEHRLRNLDSELGGGIVIETIAKDTLVVEDMIKMVGDGVIDATVVDYNIAQLNINDYPGLDATLPISLDQESQWAVEKENNELARIINEWTDSNKNTIDSLKKKYFETSKLPVGLSDNSEIDLELDLPKGNSISPYDGIFKRVAASSRFDWKLIAAVAYVESRFKNEEVSWAGARGIMQIMPKTAQALGFSPGNLNNPEVCIQAGLKLLETLDKQLSSKIPDPNRRTDFILAAYNAGLGHIYDVIALAEKYGLDKNQWQGSAEKAALMKSRPQYYRDPVVKNGYFRGQETVDFVARVNTAYEAFSTR